MLVRHIALPLVIIAVPADAAPADREPFTGPYLAAEAGMQEHHVTLVVSSPTTVSELTYRRWGPYAELAAGYDTALARAWRVGIEIGAGIGGQTLAIDLPGGRDFVLKPHGTGQATVRLGHVIGGKTLLYARGGYGAAHYAIDGSQPVRGVESWGHSFVLGAGLESRLSPRAALRFEFRHLDNHTNTVFVAMPVRF